MNTTSTTPPIRGKCAACPFVDDLNAVGLCIRCRNGLPQPHSPRTDPLMMPDRILLADEDELVRATAALSRRWQTHGFPAVAAALQQIVTLHLDDHDRELLLLADAAPTSARLRTRTRYPMLDQALAETNPFATVEFDNEEKGEFE